MRVEGLTIALRPRAPWEAVDLGVALTREHARAIAGVWLLLSAALLLLFTGFGYLIGWSWLGGVLLWWCKPLLDRIPLYVLSRALLGQTPDWRETLRAQRDWGWAPMWHWLSWRRLHPGRCVLLPMDLLERPRGPARRARARLLGNIAGSPHYLLTVVGVHLETVLAISLVLLLGMFIPTEFLDDTLKAALDALVEAPPPWLSAANNLLYWLALVVIEPVYVGAGFALYLNRRTQLEAWDIELAFRRLAARLAATAKATALLLLFGGALLWPAPTPAGEPLPEREDSASEALAQRLGSDFHADPAAFEAAASKAVADPLLRPKEIASGWRRRHPAADDPDAPSLSWLDGVAAFIGLVMENMLWIGLAIALIVVLRHRQWLAGWWRRDAAAAAPALPAESLREADEVLPDDLAAAVDALWRQGKARAALALFYRGALQRLDTRLPRPLPPGATEADGLRAARRLGDDPFARLFASLVAAWQAAAYADRWPLEGQLQGWLQQWRQLAGQGGP